MPGSATDGDVHMTEEPSALMVPGWVPDILRYIVIGLVALPGVGKFLSYSQSVDFFVSLGIPAPEITVLLVGVIELGAAALLLVNVGRWIAALALLPVMVVALVTAGDWQALAVLLAVLGLLAVDLDLLVVRSDESSG